MYDEKQAAPGVEVQEQDENEKVLVLRDEIIDILSRNHVTYGMAMLALSEVTRHILVEIAKEQVQLFKKNLP